MKKNESRLKGTAAKLIIVAICLVPLLMIPRPAFAMHIMEGFLPLPWAIFWWVVSLPVIYLGIQSIKKKLQDHPELKMMLGVAGGFAFVLSALKIPSVAGSSSHPTGVGLGAVLFGPLVMTVLGFIVLLFQALLLAHGGISTLGANTFSMAIVGPFVAYGIYKAGQRMQLSQNYTIFLAAAIGSMSTYIVTAMQLSMAFPAETGGILVSAQKFLTIFAVTQLPLAVSEGVLTVIFINFLRSYGSEDLMQLGLMKREVA